MYNSFTRVHIHFQPESWSCPTFLCVYIHIQWLEKTLQCSSGFSNLQYQIAKLCEFDGRYLDFNWATFCNNSKFQNNIFFFKNLFTQHDTIQYAQIIDKVVNVFHFHQIIENYRTDWGFITNSLVNCPLQYEHHNSLSTICY